MLRKIYLILGLVQCLAASWAQELPDRKDVLATLCKVNEYFMKQNPDPSVPTFVKRMRPSSLWTRGVYYEGLMALYEIHPRQEYYDYAYAWGEHHKWLPRNGNTTRHADDQCCLQTYIDLYKLNGERRLIQGAITNMNMMAATPMADDWWWIDAIQMAMPVLTKLYSVTKEQKYLDKAWELYRYTRDELGGNGMLNPKDGLWWRDADFDPPYTEPNGEDCYWSRGNGWVIAALARVMTDVPSTDTHYADYKKDFLTISKALKACQREDGFWNVSLHDPSNFGGKETTGTALFVYGMAWGINNGLLDRKEYLPVVLKAWDAMAKDAIHPNGYIGYVQGTGKQPSDGQPCTHDSHPDFEDYGTGCLLLAGSEVYKLK